MSISDGNYRYPVAGNRQHIITTEENTVVDAFIIHPDGRLEEIDRNKLDQDEVQEALLDELEAQRKGGHQ